MTRRHAIRRRRAPRARRRVMCHAPPRDSAHAPPRRLRPTDRLTERAHAAAAAAARTARTDGARRVPCAIRTRTPRPCAKAWDRLARPPSPDTLAQFIPRKIRNTSQSKAMSDGLVTLTASARSVDSQRPEPRASARRSAANATGGARTTRRRNIGRHGRRTGARTRNGMCRLRPRRQRVQRGGNGATTGPTLSRNERGRARRRRRCGPRGVSGRTRRSGGLGSGFEKR
jgi:hypothetical protein